MALTRGWTQPAKKHLEVQTAVQPKTHGCRILVVKPTLAMLTAAYEELLQAGVPEHASLHFQQWKAPDDNYYIVATWEEEESDPSQ